MTHQELPQSSKIVLVVAVANQVQTVLLSEPTTLPLVPSLHSIPFLCDSAPQISWEEIYFLNKETKYIYFGIFRLTRLQNIMCSISPN